MLSQSEERLSRALTGDPLTVREARALLRRLGKSHWQVDAVVRDRFFVLTAPVLHMDGTMRRQAMTALLQADVAGQVEIRLVEGWQV